MPPSYLPIPPTEKAKPGALLTKCLGNLLLIAIVLVGLWLWTRPSKDDIRETAQNAFLELCQENQWDITEANVKEFTVISKSWLKSYAGFITLKTRDSETITVLVEILLEDGLFEYQVHVAVEAHSMVRLNAYFSDDEE